MSGAGCATTGSRASRPTRCSPRSPTRSTAADSRARSSRGRPPDGHRGDRGPPARWLRRPAQAGRLPRRPLLRPRRRALGALHAPRPVAGAAAAGRCRGGRRRRHPALPRRLRPRKPREPRALVRHYLAGPGRPLAARPRRPGRRGAALRRARRHAGRGRRRRPPRPAGRRGAAAARLRPPRRRRPARPRRRPAAPARRPRLPPAGLALTGRVRDGRIAGTWSHEARGSRLAVEVAPFEPPRGVRRAIEEEAAALAGFLGGEPELRWA
jgi:hypothetical protein